MAEFVAKKAGFEAIVELRGSPVEVDVYPDGEEAAFAVGRGQAVVVRLAELESSAKGVAVRDLLETYNDCWRDADDGDDEERPELSGPEFVARLRLTHVNVEGAAGLSLFFADGGLFGGHSVIVESVDGGLTWRRAYL